MSYLCTIEKISLQHKHNFLYKHKTFMINTYRKHLSPNFILYEFVRSGIAIEKHIDNNPLAPEREALASLCSNILEPLRKTFGPIVISSGYRCQRLNKLVGGADNSQHCKGEAADIVACSPERLRNYFIFIKRNLDFDQLIMEPVDAEVPRWLHVSYTKRRRNRHEIVGREG